MSPTPSSTMGRDVSRRALDGASHSAADRTGGDAGVVLLAAGGSTRMGGADKTLADLLGRPVIAYSLDVFHAAPRVGQIVIVASDDNLDRLRGLVAESGYTKVVACLPGGARRQDSAATGVEWLRRNAGPGVGWALVHDAARPFIDTAMIERGLEAASATGAAVPSVPVADTIKRADAGGLVAETLDRRELHVIQTPQVFRLEVLVAAQDASADVTDDASLVERTGVRVALFAGDEDNIKLTMPSDLERAVVIAARRRGVPAAAGAHRWGTGFDGHALVGGGPLRLGGLDIEFDHRLEGHSDGDVLLHAVTSALLGAAGLGDLGGRFPSDDKSLRGVDSSELLRTVAREVADAGWVVAHLDATIVAQRPKLSPYVRRISESIALNLQIDVDSVNVKVTSTDRVGAIGKGEGIAAEAVVTLAAGHAG